MINRLRLVLITLLKLARFKPWEPVLIIIALLIATGGVSSVWLINEGARQGDIASQTPSVFANAHITAAHDDIPLTRNDYVSLRRAGFTEWIALSEDTRPLTCADDSGVGKQVDGLDIIGADTQVAQSWLVTSERYSASEATTGIVAFASPSTAARYACPGGIIRKTGHTIASVRAVNGLPDDVLVVPINAFYTGQVTPKTHPLTALLAIENIDPERQQAVKAVLPEHLQLEQASTTLSKGNLSESFRLNLWAMGVLMAVVALFIVLNAMLLMYRSRLSVAVRLRQMGVSARLLQAALLAELAVYCLISTPIGVIAGLYLTRQLTPVLQQTFSALFDSAFISPAPFLVQTISGALLITFVALSIFCVITGRQLTRATATASVRFSEWPLKWRIAISAAIVLVTGLLVWLADTTLSALVSVAAVLLGGSALIILWLPHLTRRIRDLVPPRYVLPNYVAASAITLSGKTRLAVCAFFIALSANIGMNVMTDSFRQATESWLSQRLSAPAYLYTEQSYEKVAATLPDAQAVFRGTTSMASRRVTVRSFPGSESARQSLALDAVINNDPEQAWQDFTRGKAVFVNQQFALTFNKKIADTIALDAVYPGDKSRGTPSLASQSYQIAGIYPDYGNPDTQVLLPVSRFAPAEGFSGVVALYDETAASEATLSALGETYDASKLIARSMQTFDRTFVVTDALNISTLLVAGLCFAISVSVLMMDLRPQLSVLRALGVHQWQIKLTLLAQYMVFCLLTALLAVPFGILLAWVFISRVNRYAFYWYYPMDITLSVLMQSVFISLVVVLCVLLLPVGRIKANVDLRQEAAV
ncbi:FtsX-like permease family protein [Salinimonas sp. HHU 13199]|uniref:FtsX-like permease family protein n=1 Tax=Salinimonas profundi TaxID=2729140 RepID=A0ABR8LK54_9ALTE|nr:ABC transporter permease [Salinimonas profundi]MBD3586574.1 FtsX-like permease family protein [Salinimonas profundi]